MAFCFNCDYEKIGTAGKWADICDRCRPRLENVDPDCEEALIGRAIANNRRQRGITQLQLARAIGISRTSLAQYEGGVQAISITRLYQIAKVFKMEARDLVVPNNTN